MHPVLLRQLRKLGIDPDALPDAAGWPALLERVSRNYVAADQERYLLERSLNLASSEMRELHEHLQAIAEQRYQDLFESANDIIFTADAEGTLTSVNRACVELTGYQKEDLLGRPWQQFFASTAISPGLPTDARFEVDTISRAGQRVSLEFSTRVVTHAGEPQELLGVGRDISERRMNEARLEYLAHHDPLTGLPNRGVLEEALLTVITSAEASDEAVVLGLLDLDDFKLVNDTMGHVMGDEMLLRVADILRRCLPHDTIARISGDEFAFILRVRSDAEALQTAERVRREIATAELHAQNQRLFVTASIGLVRADAAASPGGLLAEADAAMYRAKEEGRNRVHWSRNHDSITGGLAVIQRWGAAVRAALESDRLVVHYQPIVPLNGDGPGHYEALLRMHGEGGEPIPASLFLPAAERSGLMAVIDDFVLRTVLKQLRAAPEAHIFANLSAATLADPQALASLMTVLRREPSVAARLGLEITETTALHDVDLAREWIEQLSSIGCRFALDDFGTGFNSLTHLLQLPVHHIKIDGSFIRGMATDHSQRAIVSAVKVLADGLGMETVAECIETPEVLELLRALGVTYGQGYLLGRPAPHLVDRLRVAA